MRLRTKDDPEANGRQPRYGDERWTINMPLENGEILYIEMGRKSRDVIFGMLIADCVDSGEKEPA
jgi:hypothetical protein